MNNYHINVMAPSAWIQITLYKTSILFVHHQESSLGLAPIGPIPV